MLWHVIALGVAASPTRTITEPLTLWILPHSHADVGWLQTVNSLARVNVSRILSGVVAALDADPSRRFVWDEMAFLQAWWERESTEAERARFKAFVQARRIEMVDNGWSQHVRHAVARPEPPMLSFCPASSETRPSAARAGEVAGHGRDDAR
jgi:hypothetical protein